MADLGISEDDLQKLAQLLEQYQLSELRYEEGDLRVTLRTSDFVRASQAPTPILYAAPGTAPLTVPESDGEPADNDQMLPPVADGTAGSANQRRIEAPVMGVFYRSPSPGEAPYVEIGDTIELGQVVGMIEAMKVFSEVPAEITGRIVAIPAKNGALVQPGDALFVVEEGA